MAGKFELKKTANDKFMYNLKAGNGQVIMTSNHYETKAAAEHAIRASREHAPDDGNFERKTSKDDQFFFNLKDKDGDILGKSEMYTAKASMENGIESVKKNAPDAEVDDITALELG